MNLQAAVVQTQSSAAPGAGAAVLERKCKCGSHKGSRGACPACASGAKLLQRKHHSAWPGEAREEAWQTVEDVVSTPGKPLDEVTRAFMQERFGHDFSQVRLHSDAAAERSANMIHAHAYTAGNHIVFGPRGMEVSTLAHELTHVVQQSRFSGLASPHTVSPANDAAESEADSAAAHALRGEQVSVSQAPVTGVQRLTLSKDAKIGLGVAGGIVGGVGAGLFIAWLAGAFDKENFPDEELKAYLAHLAETHKIEDHRDSDNKARDLVRKWSTSKTPFDLDAGFTSDLGTLTGVDLKRLLILEMLSGVTGGDDENAIVTILDKSTPEDLYRILDPRLGLSIQQLDDKIGGENHKRLEAVLDRKYPKGKASAAQVQTEKACSARQELMIMYARRTAMAMVVHALDLLSKNPLDSLVKSALDCRFHGAKDSDIKKIFATLADTANQLTARVYVCGAEDPAQKREQAKHLGSDLDCSEADAISFPTDTGTTEKWVYLCPVFFTRPPELQAIVLVHESAHAAKTKDIEYQPECGFAVEKALQNADSFAWFVDDLSDQGGTAGASTALPTVMVGNFRNTGQVSPENECPVCEQIPGLGLDTQTGLNMMELRGDISGHKKGIVYDFRRTKEQAIWRGEQGHWKLVHYEPKGTDDDRFNTDEQLTPRNNHIYAIDGPGLASLTAPLGEDTKNGDEALFKGNFVDYVEASASPGAWNVVSNDFAWHSVTWLEKDDQGGWKRKDGENEIAPGPARITAPKPAPEKKTEAEES